MIVLVSDLHPVQGNRSPERVDLDPPPIPNLDNRSAEIIEAGNVTSSSPTDGGGGSPDWKEANAWHW
jgi:hypothetical protein